MTSATPRFTAQHQLLLQRRSAVLARLERNTHGDDGGMQLPNRSAETDAELSAELDAVDLAQALLEDAELKRIDAALARIDSGDYGACEDCGTSIEAARLLAEPTALRCISCQTRFEKTHG